MNAHEISNIILANAEALTGEETDSLDYLNINFSYDYKNSLALDATSNFTIGNDKYSCELAIKITKNQA